MRQVMIGRYGYAVHNVGVAVTMDLSKKRATELLDATQNHLEAVDKERLGWQKEYHNLKSMYFKTPSKKKEVRQEIVFKLVDIEEILAQLDNDIVTIEHKIELIEKRLLEVIS